MLQYTENIQLITFHPSPSNSCPYHMQNPFLLFQQLQKMLTPASTLKFEVGGETQGSIHPEAKFLSSCESVKLNKLCDSKIQWWDGHRIDIPIPKRRNRKEGTVDVSLLGH